MPVSRSSSSAGSPAQGMNYSLVRLNLPRVPYCSTQAAEGCSPRSSASFLLRFGCSMQCAICGRSINSSDATVPTRDGAIVHIICADQQASIAWEQLRRTVIWQTIFLLAGLLILWCVLGNIPFVIIGAMVGTVAHIRINHIWWQRLAFRLWRGTRVKS